MKARRSIVISSITLFTFIAGRNRCSSGGKGGLAHQISLDYAHHAAQARRHSVRGSENANTVSTSTSKSMRQSFGLIQNISDVEWEALRKDTKNRSMFFNTDNPLENVQDPPYWNRYNLNATFDCNGIGFLEKVGNLAKGETKFVCNPKGILESSNLENRKCVVYSCGSAGDFRFEDAIFEMHNGKCEIHVFDPAPSFERPGDAEKKNIHYHAWGFQSSYDDSNSVVWPKGRRGSFRTLAATFKELGHENTPIDIFKIDCEGCEWSTHKDWIDHDIRQILMETHGVPNPQGSQLSGGDRWYQKPFDLLQYYQDFLDRGYAIFSKDPNNELCLELGFIKLHREFWER